MGLSTTLICLLWLVSKWKITEFAKLCILSNPPNMCPCLSYTLQVHCSCGCSGPVLTRPSQTTVLDSIEQSSTLTFPSLPVFLPLSPSPVWVKRKENWTWYGTQREMIQKLMKSTYLWTLMFHFYLTGTYPECLSGCWGCNGDISRVYDHSLRFNHCGFLLWYHLHLWVLICHGEWCHSLTP